MAKINRLPPGREALDTLTAILFDQFVAEADLPTSYDATHQLCYLSGLHMFAMRMVGLYTRAGMISPRQAACTSQVFLLECERRIATIERDAKAQAKRATVKRSTPETGPPDSEQEAVLTFARGVEQSGSSRGS